MVFDKQQMVKQKLPTGTVQVEDGSRSLRHEHFYYTMKTNMAWEASRCGFTLVLQTVHVFLHV